MKNLKIIIPALLYAGLYLAGCHAKSQDSSPEVVQAKHLEVDSIQTIVAQTRQSYKAMDNAALLTKLEDQSKRRKEPFNSLAYREMAGRKDVNPDTLVALIHQLKDGNAILPLLLLRAINDKAYTGVPVETKVNILTNALQQSKTFNMWGLPGKYPEEASKALIACGRSAIPTLTRMLKQTSPAPLYGSKESMVYQHYKFRLCDYALYFIEEIQGNTNFVMPVTAAERDALITKI
jgi:hypothetical protein